MQRSSLKYIGLSILVIVGVFGLGFFLGSHGAVQSANADGVNTNIFWKVWSIIDSKYPDANKITGDARVVGATKGLVDSLGDPYSEFFNAEETKDFSDTIEGSFGGIGLEIDEKDGALFVISALKDTPAEKAGFRAKDVILKINDKSTADMSVDDAIKLIRGAIGTKVSLTVASEGDTKPRTVSVTRAQIVIPTVETKEAGNGIFAISLYSFNAQAITEFNKAIEQFKKSDDTKLILDLRGNPGGYLDAAEIGSWFIPKGKTIVTENYGDNKAETVHRSKGYDLGKKDLKLMVLIDGGSASASEILAGALQDYDLAELVGEKSYGKGSVQEVIDVTSTMELKLTVAKWLTPNRHSISKIGLTPDVAVEQKEQIKNPGDANDLQFSKAVQLLK